MFFIGLFSGLFIGVFIGVAIMCILFAGKDDDIWNMKVECRLCRTIIEGDKKGTFITCNCGKCAIDETPYYARLIGNIGDYEQIKE